MKYRKVLMYLSLLLPMCAHASDRNLERLLQAAILYGKGVQVSDSSYQQVGVEWRVPNDPYAYEKLEILKEFRSPNGRFELRLLLRRPRTGGSEHLFITFSYDLDREITRQMLVDDYQAILTVLGPPAKEIDIGFRNPPNDAQFHQVTADWFVGENRIRFNSSAFAFPGSVVPIVPHLIIQNANLSRDLVDLLGLRLNTKECKVSGRSTWDSVDWDPLVYLMDMNSNTLFTSSFSPFGRITDVSDFKIVAVIEKEDVKITVSLDRYAGTFEMALDNIARPEDSIVARGTVTPFELQKSRLF